MTFHATCITLFPEAFPGILGVSIVGTALRQGIWQLDTVDIREHGVGKHRLRAGVADQLDRLGDEVR